tara:strand:+ start:256 stop:513 length:258 start_codon:yes stop_codon:yes gene_type:complete
MGSDKNQVKIIGEDTGKIKVDKNNQSYVLQGYDGVGAMKGDTIQLSGDFPKVDGKLIEGDYYGKETTGSKKRKDGPKTFNIRTEE